MKIVLGLAIRLNQRQFGFQYLLVQKMELDSDYVAKVSLLNEGKEKTEIFSLKSKCLRIHGLNEMVLI